MANWQEGELLLTLQLYCRTPFGKLHNRNPDVIQLANAIGRTASAVALKATNLASLDESIPQTGMSNTSKADRAWWAAFIGNSGEVAADNNGARGLFFNYSVPLADRNPDFIQLVNVIGRASFAVP